MNVRGLGHFVLMSQMLRTHAYTLESDESTYVLPKRPCHTLYKVAVILSAIWMNSNQCKSRTFWKSGKKSSQMLHSSCLKYGFMNIRPIFYYVLIRLQQFPCEVVKIFSSPSIIFNQDSSWTSFYFGQVYLNFFCFSAISVRFPGFPRYIAPTHLFRMLSFQQHIVSFAIDKIARESPETTLLILCHLSEDYLLGNGSHKSHQ